VGQRKTIKNLNQNSQSPGQKLNLGSPKYKAVVLNHLAATFSYLQIRLYMPSSNGSLVITIKMNAKFRFCAAAMLLFYILQKISLNNEVRQLCYDERPLVTSCLPYSGLHWCGI
jgi:hypothetical protein